MTPQDVRTGRAPGCGHQPDPARDEGQGLLAGGVEEPLRGQPSPAFVQHRDELALPGRLYPVQADLQATVTP